MISPPSDERADPQSEHRTDQRDILLINSKQSVGSPLCDRLCALVARIANISRLIMASVSRRTDSVPMFDPPRRSPAQGWTALLLTLGHSLGTRRLVSLRSFVEAYITGNADCILEEDGTDFISRPGVSRQKEIFGRLTVKP